MSITDPAKYGVIRRWVTIDIHCICIRRRGSPRNPLMNRNRARNIMIRRRRWQLTCARTFRTRLWGWSHLSPGFQISIRMIAIKSWHSHRRARGFHRINDDAHISGRCIHCQRGGTIRGGMVQLFGRHEAFILGGSIWTGFICGRRGWGHNGHVNLGGGCLGAQSMGIMGHGPWRVCCERGFYGRLGVNED